MKKFLSLCFCLFVASAALGEDIPKPGSGDERVRWINYDAWQVVNVRTVARTVTQITFSENEAILQVSLGDTVGWETVVAGNNVLLKPREIHPPTNMTIITRRANGSFRSYQFYLQSREGEIGTDSDVFFAIKFKYPQDEADQKRAEADARRMAQEENNTLLGLSFEGEKNWAYSAQGNPDLEPSEMSDNGQVTFMKFPGRFPAIYAVSADGTDEIVNYTTEGDTVILHAVSRQWHLRQGKQVLCIWNEAFKLRPTNPGTGTITPHVERIIRRVP